MREEIVDLLDSWKSRDWPDVAVEPEPVATWNLVSEENGLEIEVSIRYHMNIVNLKLYTVFINGFIHAPDQSASSIEQIKVALEKFVEAAEAQSRRQ